MTDLLLPQLVQLWSELFNQARRSSNVGCYIGISDPGLYYDVIGLPPCHLNATGRGPGQCSLNFSLLPSPIGLAGMLGFR